MHVSVALDECAAAGVMMGARKGVEARDLLVRDGECMVADHVLGMVAAAVPWYGPSAAHAEAHGRAASQSRIGNTANGVSPPGEALHH